MTTVGSVYDAFRRSLYAYPNRAMVCVPEQSASIYGMGPLSMTYSEVGRSVDETMERYRASGYGPGARVALMLENRPEFFTEFLALNGLGVSVVPIHHQHPTRDITYLLDHSGVEVVVCVEAQADVAAAAARDTRQNTGVVVVGDGPAMRTGSRTPAAVGQSREAAVLYTSGSSGRPKGCSLSNRYFVLMGAWYASLGGLCRLSSQGERLITPLPLTHMNAMACSFMAMVMTGGCLIQLDRFHPSSWWQSVRESRATIIHYLGVMPAILLSLERKADEHFGGQVKFGFGAGVDPRNHAAFEQRFGFPLVEAWAMTETGAGACVAASHEPRHVGMRCFGRAGPRVACRVVDEAGMDVAPGEAGELLVRAAGNEPRRGFFSAYLRDEAATEAAWQGGWFHTGDVVRVDSEGSFYFVDRRKNIIRRSGENIAAAEVENALAGSSGVRHCAVAAVADDIRGEEVMACVVPGEGVSRDRECALAIFDASREALAYFKIPGYIAFVDELPLTASEKLQRGALKKLCEDLRTRGEAFDFRSLKRPPANEPKLTVR